MAGQHKGIITALAWNLDGSLCATACKDKLLRGLAAVATYRCSQHVVTVVLDPRSGKVASEVRRALSPISDVVSRQVKDLEGAKSGRVAWQVRNRYIPALSS
jgi:hypothetical protein